ncbi:transposase, partial [Oceanobacter antarcticus]
MKTPPTDHLPDDISALKQQLLAQHQLLEEKNNQLKNKEQLINQKQSRIQFLEEQIILFKQRQFGKSSEKSDQQVELFDEVECEADASAVDTAESI